MKRRNLRSRALFFNYKIEKIEFNISLIAIPKMDWNNGKIPIKITHFRVPKKNEVTSYIELWAFVEIDRQKILLTSAYSSMNSPFNCKHNTTYKATTHNKPRCKTIHASIPRTSSHRTRRGLDNFLLRNRNKSNCSPNPSTN